MSMSACVDEKCFEFAAGLAPEAARMAYTLGVVRYARDGSGVVPMGMSLTPWAGDPGMVKETRELTPVYNKLYARMSQERDFLEESLAATRRVDEFVSRLFACLPPRLPERPWFFLNRNDCMPHLEPDGSVVPRQVEVNLIAAALGPVSAKINRIHRYLYAETELADRFWVNSAADDLVDSFVEAWKLIGDPSSQLVTLMDPGEPNRFDIRATQSRLVVDHGIKVTEASMEELGREGELRGGELYFRGRKVAIAYFRIGYAPDHYTSEHCWRCRELLEASTAVSVPTISAQLANMKKFQHILADPATLRRFVTPEEARRLERTFARFARPEDELEWRGERGRARDLARKHPEDFVLKPHREGGSNNFFGQDMVAKLSTMSREDSEAFLLMEMIQQRPFRSVRLMDGQVQDTMCYTELGVYGLYLSSGTGIEPVANREIGYLLRTKDVANKEGLVLGGFSFMDSVLR